MREGGDMGSEPSFVTLAGQVWRKPHACTWQSALPDPRSGVSHICLQLTHVAHNPTEIFRVEVATSTDCWESILHYYTVSKHA